MAPNTTSNYSSSIISDENNICVSPTTIPTTITPQVTPNATKVMTIVDENLLLEENQRVEQKKQSILPTNTIQNHDQLILPLYGEKNNETSDGLENNEKISFDNIYNEYRQKIFKKKQSKMVKRKTRDMEKVLKRKENKKTVHFRELIAQPTQLNVSTSLRAGRRYREEYLKSQRKEKKLEHKRIHVDSNKRNTNLLGQKEIIKSSTVCSKFVEKEKEIAMVSDTSDDLRNDNEPLESIVRKCTNKINLQKAFDDNEPKSKKSKLNCDLITNEANDLHTPRNLPNIQLPKYFDINTDKLKISNNNESFISPYNKLEADFWHSINKIKSDDNVSTDYQLKLDNIQNKFLRDFSENYHFHKKIAGKIDKHNHIQEKLYKKLLKNMETICQYTMLSENK